MGDSWKEYTIGDVAEIVGGGTPSTKEADNFGGTIPWLTPKDLSGYTYRYISHGERNITEKGLSNSSAKLLPPKTVLLTTRAPVGYVAIAKNLVATNQGFRSLVLRDSFDPEFVYYLLKSSTDYLQNHASGTTFGELSGSTLKSLRFLFPPLPEQKAIASTLGTLDDKIELNRKMNETMEAMVRAIFKSWFVDFDPIPGRSPHKEWQDSTLGRIPKGWRVGTLGELCEILMGQSPPGETYNETGEGLPFYQGIRDFGFRFPSKRVYCTAPTRLAEEGDVLLSVRAPVGSLNIAVESCAIGRGVAALRIKGQHYGFLYYLMKETQWEWAKFEAEGTVFGAATKTDVQNFSVIFPPTEIISRFNQIVFPIDQMIKNNDIQSHTLASIRDALLPKLLLGEIRVKDAEKFVEEGL